METPKLSIGDFALNTNAFHTGTDLHTAAVKGDKLTLQRLLKQQGHVQTVNKGDRNGRTALFYTVFGDWYDCAEILVRHGGLVLQVDADKRSVLHWAAYLSRPKFIKLFLDHVDVNLEWNLSDKDGRTALHYAAMQSNSKCLRLLLKRLAPNRPSLNATDNENMTALHWSVFYNRLENYKLLIRESADTTKRDRKGRSLLHMAVIHPSTDSVRIASLLLKQNRFFSRQVDSEQRTALHLAVANGDEEIVRELCKAEESALNDLDKHSRSVLHYAVLKNNLNVINILISAGVSPEHVDSTGASILHYAAKNNHVQIINCFLRSFEHFEDSTDNQGRTALMWAASEGATDVLNFMLCNLGYFNVHASDEQGLTALHFACHAGHEKCVQLLIEHSADISQPDNLGQTALFKACQQGHREIIDILTSGTPVDFNGQVGSRTGQGIIKSNSSPIGKKLCSIQEEPPDSRDTWRNSAWSHEASDYSPEATEKQVDETGDFLPVRDLPEGHTSVVAKSGNYTSECLNSEDLKPEGRTFENQNHKTFRNQGMKGELKELLIMGHEMHSVKSNKASDLGEFSGTLMNGSVKPGILKPGVNYHGGNSSVNFSVNKLAINELEDDNGCTPLHFAAHAGHTPVCRWLLSQGVHPGKKDVRGRTALHGAAFNGHTECMALMLADHPELVNDRDNDQYSVLHHAAINGQLEAVKLLVSENAFLNYRVKSTDWTPLDFAMAADHQDVTQFLMDNGALTIAWLQELAADTIKRFMQHVVRKKRLEKVKPLVERHEKLTKEERFKHRELEVNNVPNENDAIIDNTGCRENEDVLENHRLTMNDDQLRTFTKRENTMLADSRTARLQPTGNRLATIFDEIQICTDTSQILMLGACYHGNLARVRDLAKENTDFGYRDENGCTALHFAAAQGHDTICEYLLDHGAESFKRDTHGRTALHNAAIYGNSKCISLLLSNDKDLLWYLDSDKRSALHYAASMGHLEAVKLLLAENNGIQDLRAKSMPLTALDCAILGQHNDVIEYMVSRNAVQSEELGDAAELIERNFREGFQRKSVKCYMESSKSDKQTEEASKNNCTKVKCARNAFDGKSQEKLNDRSSAVQTNSTQKTSKISETTQIGRKSESSALKRFTSNLKTDYENSKVCAKSQGNLPKSSVDSCTNLQNPKSSLQILASNAAGINYENYRTRRAKPPIPPEPRNNRVQHRVRVCSSATFHQSNVANLSRAPDSVVVASGEKERIIELRNKWQRIAMLRRKKQAAIVIQKHFRKYMETRVSKSRFADNSTSLRESEKVEPNPRQNISPMLERVSTSVHKTIHTGKPKDENFSKSTDSSYSGASPPKRLARKGVVNRLRTVSPEYSSSENEACREKRQYKSTFPLLSPRSSSTSSPSPSNPIVSQLPYNRRGSLSASNRHVDVGPSLTKNELVNHWLFKNAGNSSLPDDTTTRVINTAKTSDVIHTKPNTKTDPSKGQLDARRHSSVSARIRRDSLIKTVYGSPATLSYNIAVDTYHPLSSRRGRKNSALPFRTSSRIRPNSFKRVDGGWVHKGDHAPNSMNINSFTRCESRGSAPLSN